MSDLSFLQLNDDEFKQFLASLDNVRLYNTLWDMRDDLRNVLKHTYLEMIKKRMQSWYKASVKQMYNVEVDKI